MCEQCTKYSALLSNIYQEIYLIRSRLTKDFPDLTFVGGAYTIKMLDDDLKKIRKLK